MPGYRTETDSMGPIRVPADRYYGAQTARSLVHFAIGAGKHGQPGTLTLIGVVLGQFLIAVYGGYFGAGIGILMLSVLPFMGTENIHQTNAAKTILAAVINGVTVLIFIVEGVVVWKYALVMAAAAIVGGYLGAHFARKLPTVYVRALVIVIGFGLGGYYLWKEFTGGNP